MERHRFGPRHRCEVEVEPGPANKAVLNVFLQEKLRLKLRADWALELARHLPCANYVEVTNGKVEINHGANWDFDLMYPSVLVVIDGDRTELSRVESFDVSTYVEEAMRMVATAVVLED